MQIPNHKYNIIIILSNSSTAMSSDKIPWVDKYRPSKVDNITCQEIPKKYFNDTLKTGNLPHTLLYGPPGTGKTSIVLALAINLFGPNRVNERVIELNASDERGINIVRDKIINFCKRVSGTPDPNYLSPPYKIVILDEADAMTNDAQSALRKVMEDYSVTTRFCFMCNYLNQMIKPIQSRCVIFRFNPLSGIDMVDRLKYISTKEHLEEDLEEDAIEAIVEASNGDMRKSIMQLQSLKYYIRIKQRKLTKDDIYEINNMISKVELHEIISKCTSPDTKLNELIGLVQEITSKSFPIGTVLSQLHNELMMCDSLTDEMKIKINMYMAEIEGNLFENASEYSSIFGVLGCVFGVSRNIECKFNSIDTYM